MKYIRTKNSIYEFVRDADDWVVAVGSVQKQLGCKCTIRKSSILKQADTIEELCDELVLKDLDTGMCFTMSAVHIQDIRDNWKNLMDNDYLKNHTIYGAIWTDKGLIYVAKMNEKGKLELL